MHCGRGCGYVVGDGAFMMAGDILRHGASSVVNGDGLDATIYRGTHGIKILGGRCSLMFPPV